MTSSQQELVKWTALAVMVFDHVGAVLLSGDAQQLARSVGRLAFPLFAFLIAYNIGRRGVPVSRYARPLALFSFVSLVPHWAVFGVGSLNIFPTLFLGVALIEAASRPAAFVVVVVGVVALGGVLGYGAAGALLVFVLWAALRVGGWVWGAVAVVVLVVNLGHPAAWVGLLVPVVLWIAGRMPVELRRAPAWVFWWFYPVHLAVLAVVRLGVRYLTLGTGGGV